MIHFYGFWAHYLAKPVSLSDLLGAYTLLGLQIRVQKRNRVHTLNIPVFLRSNVYPDNFMHHTFMLPDKNKTEQLPLEDSAF